jgi:hypothetical protein
MKFEKQEVGAPSNRDSLTDAKVARDERLSEITKRLSRVESEIKRLDPGRTSVFSYERRRKRLSAIWEELNLEKERIEKTELGS